MVQKTTVPSQDALDKKFGALVESGFRFLERALQEVEEHPTFSVAHFATGLELILKARLFREHWSLIAENPHGTSWRLLCEDQGTLNAQKEAAQSKTVAAQSSLKILQGLTGSPSKNAVEEFTKAFKHRNRAVHFLPHEDASEITKAQVRAWYYLNALIQEDWKEHFARFADRTLAVSLALKKNAHFLDARFEDIGDLLKKLDAKQELANCDSCQRRAAQTRQVIKLHGGPSIQSMNCHVCDAFGQFVDFSCGCHISTDDLPQECQADERHPDVEHPNLNYVTYDGHEYSADSIVCLYCHQGYNSVVQLESGEDLYLCMDCERHYRHVWECVKCDLLTAVATKDEIHYGVCHACSYSE